MRKFAYCLTLVSCFWFSASATAQVYNLSGPAGCGCDSVAPGAGFSQGCDSGVGCGGGSGCDSRGLGGGLISPGCGTGSVGHGGLIGGGCGIDGGMIGPGCGADAGCGGGLQTGIMSRRRNRRFNNRAPGCFYFSADIGWSVMDSPAETITNLVVVPPQFKIEDALVGRLGIGRYYGKWRLEAEGGYREYDVNDIVNLGGNYYEAQGTRKTTTAMLNFFRDFGCHRCITPYAKGGVGISHNETSGQQTFPAAGAPQVTFQYPNDETYELAWSVGGGLGIALNHRMILDLEYQYIDLGATSTGLVAPGNGLGFGDGWAHEFTMGLRMNF